jgi:hypothetical protein
MSCENACWRTVPVCPHSETYATSWTAQCGWSHHPFANVAITLIPHENMDWKLITWSRSMKCDNNWKKLPYGPHELWKRLTLQYE